MITKKCNDHFGYGCTLEVNVEYEEELSRYFYRKNTHSGAYYRNTCKECDRRRHRDKYADGSYNWRKKKLNKEGYAKEYSIGADNDSKNSSE